MHVQNSQLTKFGHPLSALILAYIYIYNTQLVIRRDGVSNNMLLRPISVFSVLPKPEFYFKSLFAQKMRSKCFIISQFRLFSLHVQF